MPPTYCEVSPSGKGLHYFLYGKLPPELGNGKRNSKTGVEMYNSSRYFTMTGNRWHTCVDEIAHDNGVIEWIYSNYIKPKRQSNSRKQAVNQGGISTLPDEKLLEMAKASKDGADFDALWRGQWEGNPKYPSQSEADFALCRKLAFWSNRDEGQIHRMFRESGLMRDKWDAQHGNGTYGEITVRRACEATKNTYAPKAPAKKLPLKVYEQNGVYYRKHGENVERLTNFIIKPIEILKGDDEAQLTCELISIDGESCIQYFLADDFSNAQRFKKVLNKNTIGFCFFGTDKGLEDLKEYINRLEWKRKKGVKALGIYRQNNQMVFVTPTMAMTAGEVKVDTIIQLEKYKSLDSRILEYPLLKSEEWLALSEQLLIYNEPAKTVSILAWVAACFIKPYLKRKPMEAKFPHLFLMGIKGSGKSATLEKIILPIFARSKITSSNQATPFPLMKENSSSNVIPQALNEFKPSTMEKYKVNALCSHFRDVYDGHDGQRGRADQSMVTYSLLAPIILAGEASPQESAIRERTIELLFSVEEVEDSKHKEAFSRLRQIGYLLPSLGKSLLDTALQLTVKDVGLWYQEGESRYLKDEFPARITSNLACMYAGLKLVERFCAGFGYLWYNCFPIARDGRSIRKSHENRQSSEQ
jgi:hypothetical protein